MKYVKLLEKVRQTHEPVRPWVTSLLHSILWTGDPLASLK